MMEDDFFNQFFNKLQEEIDNEDFISKLKTMVENKTLTQTKYKRLIKEIGVEP